MEEMMNDLEEIFGEVIFSYTRKQAIEDGVLIEVPEEVFRKCGMKIHTAITIDLWHALVQSEDDLVQSEKLHDFLWVVYMAILKHNRDTGGHKHRFTFNSKDVTIMVDIGPGDQGEPVLTIGFPSDF